MRVRAAAVLLVGSLASGAPAWAPDAGSSCSEQWQGADGCHLNFKGFPIIVSATAEANNPGNARVRAWVELRWDPTTPGITFLSCDGLDEGNGTAACSNGIPDESSPYPWYGSANLFQIFCEAEGVFRGTLSCISGNGS